MDGAWESEFRQRLRSFEAGGPSDGGAAASIKIRVTSGCFHRECSPNAYDLIDRHLGLMDRSGFGFVEHESGPELLILVAAATGAFQLASSLIDFVTTIFQARREGVSEGDRPAEPLELLVRRFDKAGTLREEVVLRVPHGDAVDRDEIGQRLVSAIERITDDRNAPGSQRPK